MKLTLALTLRLDRTPKPEPEPAEPPYTQDNGYAHIEHAGQETPPLGFTAPPTNPWTE